MVRFRAAPERRQAKLGDRAASVAAVAETMATAGKAVAFSAATVLASLASILIVPSPAFRSMVAVLAATLTLLPAVLGKLGTRVNSTPVVFGMLAALAFILLLVALGAPLIARSVRSNSISPNGPEVTAATSATDHRERMTWDRSTA